MSGAELAAVGAGAVCVVGAVAWRELSRRRAHAAVSKALCSPHAASRLAALELVAGEGVASYARILGQRTGVESDPVVRRQLAEVVARGQWEPAGDEQLVQLRLWAHRELADDRPAAVPAATVPAPAARPPAPVGAAVARRSLPAAGEPDGAGGGGAVLVTGAGGPAGVAVVTALGRLGRPVVAVDADRDAVGLRLAPTSATVPRADEPGFVDALVAVARASGAVALVPTVAEELLALAAGADRLAAAGVASWLPEPDAVLDCTDKWRFAKVAEACAIATPTTGLGSAEAVPGPWVVKPRHGRGSRDVYYADDEDGLAYAMGRVDEPVVQTRLVGREFTVDALVARNGVLAGAVPRWRLETRGGISTRGETFFDPGLLVDVAALLDAVGLTGPANVQGFVADDGSVSFTEVNPRFSGGLPLSLAAGADLVGEYLRGVLGRPVRSERCTFRPGVVMLRHFSEVIEQR